MADTTTIATQGHFGTVTDRIVAIATQGHFLGLEPDSFPIGFDYSDPLHVFTHKGPKHGFKHKGSKYRFTHIQR